MATPKEKIVRIGIPPEVERSKNSEQLQKQLTEEVEYLHLRFSALPPRGRVHEDFKLGEKVARIADILYDDSQRIAMLLRTVPPRYYVEAEVTPHSYFGLGGQRFRFLEKRKTPDAVRYYLSLGKPLDIGGTQSELVLEASRPYGHDDHVLPHFSIVDRLGSVTVRYLNLKDLLNFRVVPINQTHPQSVLTR